jgi:hypothetical protein
LALGNRVRASHRLLAITSTGTVGAKWSLLCLRFHKPHDAAKYLKILNILSHRARTLPFVGVCA